MVGGKPGGGSREKLAPGRLRTFLRPKGFLTQCLMISLIKMPVVYLYRVEGSGL